MGTIILLLAGNAQHFTPGVRNGGAGKTISASQESELSMYAKSVLQYIKKPKVIELRFETRAFTTECGLF